MQSRERVEERSDRLRMPAMERHVMGVRHHHHSTSYIASHKRVANNNEGMRWEQYIEMKGDYWYCNTSILRCNKKKKAGGKTRMESNSTMTKIANDHTERISLAICNTQQIHTFVTTTHPLCSPSPPAPEWWRSVW